MASTPPTAARAPPSSATVLQKLKELHEETRAAFASATSDPSLYASLSQTVKDVLSPAIESMRDAGSLAFDALKSHTPEALAFWETQVAKLENVIVPSLEASLSRANLRALSEKLSAALDTVRQAAHLEVERVNPPSLDAKTPPHRLEKPFAALGV